jgi:nitrite reductase/ring-hydroxylating ferredoxin subunit
MVKSSERATLRYEVCLASELPPGSRKIVYPFRGAGIGVFNVEDRFYAVKNTCPHMGAPLCRGKLTGTTRPIRTPDGRVDMEWVREGEILRCPWHHWEFELASGRTLFPSRQRVATYRVTIESAVTESTVGAQAAAGDDVPSVETYPVVVEDATVYLVLKAR